MFKRNLQISFITDEILTQYWHSAYGGNISQQLQASAKAGAFRHYRQHRSACRY
jgi:hypothetical protein